jgi:hypothetical protein
MNLRVCVFHDLCSNYLLFENASALYREWLVSCYFVLVGKHFSVFVFYVVILARLV